MISAIFLQLVWFCGFVSLIRNDSISADAAFIAVSIMTAGASAMYHIGDKIEKKRFKK